MTAAERKRRQRARQQPVVSHPAPVISEEKLNEQLDKSVREAVALNQLLPPKSPRLSENEYVQLALAKAGPFKDVTRLGNAEYHARLLYRRVCAGVTASL